MLTLTNSVVYITSVGIFGAIFIHDSQFSFCDIWGSRVIVPCSLLDVYWCFRGDEGSNHPWIIRLHSAITRTIAIFSFHVCLRLRRDKLQWIQPGFNETTRHRKQWLFFCFLCIVSGENLVEWVLCTVQGLIIMATNFTRP